MPMLSSGTSVAVAAVTWSGIDSIRYIRIQKTVHKTCEPFFVLPYDLFLSVLYKVFIRLAEMVVAEESLIG